MSDRGSHILGRPAYGLTSNRRAMNLGFGRIFSQLSAGVKSRVYLTPAKTRLVLAGGFPYEAFDGQSCIKPWHIIHLIESTRAACFWEGFPQLKKPQFLDVDRLLDDHLLYQVTANVNLFPAMYDFTVPKLPLVVDKELVYVGKSSLNINSQVFVLTDCPKSESPQETEIEQSSLTELASCMAQSVTVNIKTGRPQPLPDWWREKYQKFSNPDLQLMVKPENEPSGERMKLYQLRINHSDIDPYLHANWSSYFKYCLDGMYGAGQAESDGISIARKVKKVEVLYANEGNLGEWLEVRSWRSSISDDLLHCNIVSSSTGELKSYAVVEFYPATYFDKTTPEL